MKNQIEDKDTRVLCHACADKLSDRSPMRRLIYGIRGKHKCEECSREFTVTFEPAEKVTQPAP